MQTTDDVAEDSAQGEAGEFPGLRFVRPIPGFEGLEHYVLVRLGGEGGAAEVDAEPVAGHDDAADGVDDHQVEDDPGSLAALYELRSMERPSVRFLVAVPAPFFPHYEVELDDATCAELELTTPGDALVLVILTIGSDGAHTTANLLAPVVVNGRTRRAVQVILSGTDWPVRATVV